MSADLTAEYIILTDDEIRERMSGTIANAVYHATGIRVRDLPITLDKLLR